MFQGFFFGGACCTRTSLCLQDRRGVTDDQIHDFLASVRKRDGELYEAQKALQKEIGTSNRLRRERDRGETAKGSLIVFQLYFHCISVTCAYAC
jgi:hypothetical protein